jgi:hypothetical protein
MPTLNAGTWGVEFSYDSGVVTWFLSGTGGPGSRGLNTVGVLAVIAQVQAYYTATTVGAQLGRPGAPSFTISSTGGTTSCANGQDAATQANVIRTILATSSNWF